MTSTMKYNHIYNENSCTSGVSRGSMATRINNTRNTTKYLKNRPCVSKWQKRKHARYMNNENPPEFMIKNKIGQEKKPYVSPSNSYSNLVENMLPIVKKQYNDEREIIINKCKHTKKIKDDYLLKKKRAEEKQYNYDKLNKKKKKNKDRTELTNLHNLNMLINSQTNILRNHYNKYKYGNFNLKLTTEYEHLLQNDNPIMNDIIEYNIKQAISKELKNVLQ